VRDLIKLTIKASLQKIKKKIKKTSKLFKSMLAKLFFFFGTPSDGENNLDNAEASNSK
jgi:hypothetical protein